jgi:hypothetical protein
MGGHRGSSPRWGGETRFRIPGAWDDEWEQLYPGQIRRTTNFREVDAIHRVALFQQVGDDLEP